MQHASANLLSIGAVDFGILVDGAVVMVENIFRQLAAREGKPIDVIEMIKDAAAEVDRPLFYAVAVIVVSFLPIYVLSGPSGTLFRPMADTMVFALVGSLIVTLMLLPVLCAWFMRDGVKERRNAIFEWIKSFYTGILDICLAAPWLNDARLGRLLAGLAADDPVIGAEFMPQLDEGALWVRATMPYTISFDESAKITPKIRDILKSFPEVTTVASELGRPDDGTDPTGFFNVEFYVGLKPYATVERRLRQQGRTDRSHQQEARSRFPASYSITHSRRKTRWTRRRPVSRVRWRSRCSGRTSIRCKRKAKRSSKSFRMCAESAM